ncbi:MAG: TonB-dependent receptor, partial [Thermoanaerobaculia bacterium]|nr:TonB-dependent receptor [Thermoanaerobaculia bacterium]
VLGVVAATAGSGLRLIDISLGGLFTAGASSAPEEEFRTLELGGHDPQNRGVTLQNLQLALSGAVDPYLRGDAYLVFQIDEEGESAVEVEEAYLTTLALPAGLQVKAGQYFAPFGRLNLQHPHGWEFADQPVVNGRMFGPDGLRGLGAQLSWLLPTPFYAEATLDLQNSNGETAYSFRSVPGEEFAGRELERVEVKSPSDLLWLGRLATSFDLTRTFTIIPALSFARGPNATGPDADTSIAGVDFYAKWKPVANDHGWPFAAIQLEAMERRYDAAEQSFDDGLLLPAEELVDRGLYLQGLWGFQRRWVAGLRYDWADGRGETADDPLRDLRRRWAANLTFYPSEYSKLRLQYNHDRAEHLDETVSSLLLQFEFLYGAHGGHKF